MPRKLDEDIPEWLIPLLPQRNRHERLRRQFLRLPLLALEQQLPNAPQVLRRPRVRITPRRPGPKRILVKLQVLASHPP